MPLAPELKLTNYELNSIAFYLLMYSVQDDNPQTLKDEARQIYDKIRGN